MIARVRRSGHIPGMLTMLLLIAAQTSDVPAAPATTPAIRALLDQRNSMSASEFERKLEALAALVEARRWLTMAAEQKQANAAFLVAQIHWFGDGTPHDRALAEHWWRVAYDGGRKDAAIHVAQAIFKQIAPDGEIADRARIPEWVQWLKTAAAEDPDPARRAQWQQSVDTLEKRD
jgi:TPR repeat protein